MPAMEGAAGQVDEVTVAVEVAAEVLQHILQTRFVEKCQEYGGKRGSREVIPHKMPKFIYNN
jgi:hypothetical protein